MARFNPDNGFLFDERMVLAQVGAANPGTFGITAVLITEFSGQHENFLAPEVPVRLKDFVGGPLNQGYMFVLELVQRHDLKPANTG